MPRLRRPEAVVRESVPSAAVERRSVLMTEYYQGIAALPPEVHQEFLADFARRHPGYRHTPTTCRCARCILAARREEHDHV